MLEQIDWELAMKRSSRHFEAIGTTPLAANIRHKDEMRRVLSEIFHEEVELYQETFLRRAWLIGPACPNCGREMRTPQSKQCVENGCPSSRSSGKILQ